MQDVCDALVWARERLPSLDLKVPGVKINASKVVVVGWSTGGTLSLTLPFTTLKKEIQPPDAVLAFYCPTDFEADSWYQPNYPENSYEASKNTYDLLEGVHDSPITEYNIPKDKMNVGGWMNLEDTRSRLVLHMNWKGQMPAVLVNGLPSKEKCRDLNGKKEEDFYQLPRPSFEDVVSISPASQIRMGNYHVPTFFIHGKFHGWCFPHLKSQVQLGMEKEMKLIADTRVSQKGTKDDLIPWQQTQQTYEDLRAQGVSADVRIVQDRVHLFDLYRDPSNEGWRAVRDGYDFLFSHAK